MVRFLAEKEDLIKLFDLKNSKVEINLTYLKKQELIFELGNQGLLEEQLYAILKDPKKMDCWEQSINRYQKEIEMEEPEKMVEVMTWMLDQKTNNIPLRSGEPSAIFQVAKA